MSQAIDTPTHPTAAPQPALTAEWHCAAPVALFIFNRPETTRRVLDAIRPVKPAVMYVIADGPRVGNMNDNAQCAAARALIDAIDWDCTVHKQYAENNLGIRRSVESGLDWVFAREDSAIVLEDDCLPHPTFFHFCAELLERYRTDDRIFTISGTDLMGGKYSSLYSYRFSRYPVIWGWATWRRAWQFYDTDMRAWLRSMQSNWLEGYLGDERAAQYWAYLFNAEYIAHTDWDYAWTFAAWQHDGLSIHPNVNLISNIGFGADATHTFNPNDRNANRPLQAIPFPLSHPTSTSRDVDADCLLEADIFGGSLTRLLARVRRLQLRERAAQTTKHPV